MIEALLGVLIITVLILLGVGFVGKILFGDKDS